VTLDQPVQQAQLELPELKVQPDLPDQQDPQVQPAQPEHLVAD
jgi:hypothetical protein